MFLKRILLHMMKWLHTSVVGLSWMDAAHTLNVLKKNVSEKVQMFDYVGLRVVTKPTDF